MSQCTKSKICCFCGRSEDDEIKFGKFYVHRGIVTHYYCMLLSSNMEQKGDDNQGILGFLKLDIQKEIRRGKRLVCSYCKKSGATLGCNNTKCKKIFHYPCGLEAGSLHQFFGEFRSFCVSHRPKQEIDNHMTEGLQETTDTICYICMDKVDPHDFINTLWASCCKKNAWFHKICVQQLAMSAGYFFKCPLCNNKKEFQKAMLTYGIFIPSQDASWELEPNAFQELLYRHDQCDAVTCLCPKGRKHTSSNAKWELILCRTCGSQGIHVGCGQLKWANPSWECTECSSILRKSNATTGSNRMQDVLQSSDSEDSDDISVGDDSRELFTSSDSNPSSASCMSSIKLRPGPQSFKLQQEIVLSKKANSLPLTENTEQNTETLRPEKDTVLDLKRDEKLKNSEEVTGKSLQCKETVNQLNDHSVTLSVSPANDIIMIESDEDDVIEISNKNTSESALPTITSMNGVKIHSSVFINNCFESKLNTTRINSHPAHIVNFQEINSLSEKNCNNLVTSNLNMTELGVSKRLHSVAPQDTVECSNLEDITFLSETNKCTNIDFSKNIKITNVTSLAIEEFANKGREGQSEPLLQPNTESLPSESAKEILYDDLITQCSSSRTDINETNFKRKSDDMSPIDNRTLVSTNTMPNKAKKVKANENALVNEIEDDVLVVLSEYVNNNDKITSKNNSIQVMTLSDKEENTVRHVASKTQENPTVEDSVTAKDCDGGAGTSPAANRGSGSIIRETKSSKPTRVPIKPKHSYSTFADCKEIITDNASASYRTTNAKSNETFCPATSKFRAPDYTRLMPKHVRLSDLKFRVHDANNLQILLYDKLSINVNTDVFLEKGNKLDAITWKTPSDKFLEPQYETSSTVDHRDVQHNCDSLHNYCSAIPSSSCINNSDNIKHETECTENYHDDSKENFDPVPTTPCRNMLNNQTSSTSLQVIQNNLIFSVNSNQINEENPVPCTCNVSMVTDIETNSKWHSSSKLGLIKNGVLDSYAVHTKKVPQKKSEKDIFFSGTECLFDTSSSSSSSSITCTDNQFPENVLSDTESLNSDYVSSTTMEKLINKVDTKRNSYKIQDTSKDFINSTTGNNVKNERDTCFRVSIDLNKVRHCVDASSNLFSRHIKKKDTLSYKEISYLNKQKDMAERLHPQNNDLIRSTVGESRRLPRPKREQSK